MFKSREKTKNQLLDAQIIEIYTQMADEDVTEETYSTLLDRVERLEVLRNAHRMKPVSADSILSLGGSIFGIVSILSYEKIGNVIATKALPFVMKVKA